LNAASGNLNVTANNIANSSTIGFKMSRAEFADVYAVSFGGVSQTATGSGVRLSNVAQQFTQGNIDFTDNNLDLAISGEGFFCVNDGGTQLYTRAGNFSVDRAGYVVNAHGQRLQMYSVDPNTGSVTNFTGRDLQLNLGANPASATTQIDINLNLDASSASIDDATYPWDITDPSWGPDSYNFSTSTTIYDSLGVQHTATLYYRKDNGAPALAANEWRSKLVITDADGTNFQADDQIVAFNADGSLATVGNVDYLATSGPWTPSTGANNFAALNINYTGSTQFGANSAVSNLVQDGYTTGRLSGVSVDPSGVVYARYTNGQSEMLGAVAMVRFPNPNGLEQVGDTNWAATYESGAALSGQAGTGTFGQIQSGALEASNVDISKQLVNMIIAQRDFQANAKMITTEDNVTQSIINIR
jgi:flagellar hook protein FlgE